MNKTDCIEEQLALVAESEEVIVPSVECWECIERVLEAQRIINVANEEIKTN